MDKHNTEGHIAPYPHAAAGWGALKYVALNLLKEKVEPGKLKALLAQNQPDGFDCPGCAWPDREHASTFEFCENGAKAVAAEATSKRAGHGRHRQGHGHAGRFRTCRHAADLWPESGHQPSAHDGRIARLRQARRADRVDQSAARTGPGTFYQSAKPAGNDQQRQHPHQLDVRAAGAERRLCAAQGAGQASRRCCCRRWAAPKSTCAAAGRKA